MILADVGIEFVGKRRQNPRFVLTPEREAEILAAWKARAP